jgi:hypothetical protein
LKKRGLLPQRRFRRLIESDAQKPDRDFYLSFKKHLIMKTKRS